MEYINLTKIKPDKIRSKIIDLYNSIVSKGKYNLIKPNNIRIRPLSKVMTKEDDIRRLMINYIRSPGLLDYYQSLKIKNADAKVKNFKFLDKQTYSKI